MKIYKNNKIKITKDIQSASYKDYKCSTLMDIPVAFKIEFIPEILEIERQNSLSNGRIQYDAMKTTP